MCYEAFKPFCVTVLVSLKNNSILTEFEFNTFKPYKEFSLICNGILLEKKRRRRKNRETSRFIFNYKIIIINTFITLHMIFFNSERSL